MCMQCVAAASVAAGATATGLRAWISAHQPSWIGARGMKKITVGILLLGVIASGLVTTPSARNPGKGPPLSNAAAQADFAGSHASSNRTK